MSSTNPTLLKIEIDNYVSKLEYMKRNIISSNLIFQKLLPLEKMQKKVTESRKQFQNASLHDIGIMLPKPDNDKKKKPDNDKKKKPKKK